MNKKEYIKRKTRGKNYINPQLCSTCLKPCCKSSGCDAIPLDINPFTLEHIIKLIDKGIYSISYTFSYNGEIIPILQSREVDAGVFIFSDEHKPCSLLGEHGCTLSKEERPTMALTLIPKPHLFIDEWRSCRQLIKTKEFLKLWCQKIDVMDKVVEHYSNGKDIETLYREYLKGKNHKSFLSK